MQIVKVEIRKAEINFCFLLSSFLFLHVASLLEVGTGFHPELTGRENVFLNGDSGLDALRAGSASGLDAYGQEARFWA